MNRLTIVAEGERGVFYLNGLRIAELDLGSRNIAGGFSAGTGFLLGNEVTGESTDFIEFQIWELP